MSTTTAAKTTPDLRRSLPKASLRDTLGMALGVAAPTIAKGVIIRRPKVVGLAEKLDLDRRAVRRLQRLRAKYGEGPLLFPIPFRPQAVILAPEHVHQVLDNSPEPFATATEMKRAALSHFEPKGALISHGPERAVRRDFNEQVLESENPMHRLAAQFVAVVNEEAAVLLAEVQPRGELTWDDFYVTWNRVVRRVIFGEGARDDHELTEMVEALRASANWAFFKPKDDDLRRRFFARMQQHLDRAEPGSLAAVIARLPQTSEMRPLHQIPQWLFAFDPAGMTTFRALALLAAHPEQAERARQEIRERAPDRQELPFLRACVLESLRLWPTTPMVLRQTTKQVRWTNGMMPKKAQVLIFAPYFHRDDQRLTYADRFAPELWLHERTAAEWPLIPFSGGQAICPGRHVVLLTTTAMLAALIDGRQVQLEPPDRLDASKPLPGTLDNYSLRFKLAG
jgi:cytochrome P450